MGFKEINFGYDADTTTLSMQDNVFQYNITFDNKNHNYIVYAFEKNGEPKIHRPYWIKPEIHQAILDYIEENWK